MPAIPHFLGELAVIPGPPPKPPHQLNYDLELAAPPNPLPVVMQPLGSPNWCWADCLSSIETYYHDHFGGSAPQTQTQIASQWLCADCSHPTQNPQACDKGYALLTVLRNYNAGQANGPLPWASIKALIDDERPICCAIKWLTDPNGNGHFILLVGYIAATQEVWLLDPQYSAIQHLPLQAFMASYRKVGQWVDSYATQSA